MLTAVNFSQPQNARFCAFSPRNLHFQKPVKYILRPKLTIGPGPGSTAAQRRRAIFMWQIKALTQSGNRLKL
jgi:hypothetical protein